MSHFEPLSPRDIEAWNAGVTAVSEMLLAAADGLATRPIPTGSTVMRRRLTVELIDALAADALDCRLTTEPTL